MEMEKLSEDQIKEIRKMVQCVARDERGHPIRWKGVNEASKKLGISRRDVWRSLLR